MKIVDRKTFLAMPAGTVYSKFEPCIFDGLFVKDETLTRDRDNTPDVPFDFVTQNLIGAINADSSTAFADKLFEAMEKGTSLDVDFDSTERDGMFDPNQRFAVLDREDVEALIERLQRALKDSEDWEIETQRITNSGPEGRYLESSAVSATCPHKGSTVVIGSGAKEMRERIGDCRCAAPDGVKARVSEIFAKELDRVGKKVQHL